MFLLCEDLTKAATKQPPQRPTHEDPDANVAENA
jgi:hypothetical protein